MQETDDIESKRGAFLEFQKLQKTERWRWTNIHWMDDLQLGREKRLKWKKKNVKEQSKSGIKLWTLRRKIYLLWTLRRNLSAEVDSPWSTEGPSFKYDKSLVSVCWRGFHYSVYQEETQAELPTLCSACLLSKSTSPCQETETFPLQSEPHNLDNSFT